MPGFLDGLRTQLKDGSFRPLPVRERKIPKPGGSGEGPEVGDSDHCGSGRPGGAEAGVEPIFEADFCRSPMGSGRGDGAHDAVAEIQYLGTRGYRWVLDADIEACFDSIEHTALMDRVRTRVKDKRVALVKAFLKAGVMTETGHLEDNPTGTPQGASCPRCWPTSP